MTWVDTHCHLQLDDLPAADLLARAEAVDWLVVPGIDTASSDAARRLTARHPGRLLWTAGLHPHDAARWPDEGDAISELAKSAAAVGECGLDYYRDLSPRGIQREAFSAQVELALELGLPLVVHVRDAFADAHDILEASGAGPQAVLHCWTGGPRWTRRFLELGAAFSFAGPIAFETGETIRLGAEHADPERCLVETDTPYLAPPPHRGEPNEPAHVALNGAALAGVWSLPVAEVARLTSECAARVFGGPPA
ncbi:MAG: TatD family hydrolase [Acidimicrobiia bacterium]